MNRLIENKTIDALSKHIMTGWVNNEKKSYEMIKGKLDFTTQDIIDAESRLKRFAPFIMKCFPETVNLNGMIESPLTRIDNTKKRLSEAQYLVPDGKLYIKQDNALAIAGSVKARGGVYEVLKVAEDIAVKNKVIDMNSDYSVLAEHRDLFNKYKIQVGSTGNMGLSIGIMSAKIGFEVTVHMSADAKKWKKDLLRKNGVNVIEYANDYSFAVAEGRKSALVDSSCHFIDDEKSRDLFLGYAVAAHRLQNQLALDHIYPDREHQLFVYIPCGVGGAPGGITFGLKEVFGDNVKCFFIEPVECPCMMLGLASGKHEEIEVHEIGLSGKTDADGLAVGRCSVLASRMMSEVLDGAFTVSDSELYQYMHILEEADHIFIEPSSCAAFEGYCGIRKYEDMVETFSLGNKELMENATHIVWATGGNLVPKSVRNEYRSKCSG